MELSPGQPNLSEYLDKATYDPAGGERQVAFADEVEVPLTFISPLNRTTDTIDLGGLSSYGTAGQVMKVNSTENGLEWGDASDGGGHVIQNEGSDLNQRTNLNFVGYGVSATDDEANDATVVTISDTDAEHDAGNSGSAITIDWSAYRNQKITLTDNCTLNAYTAPSGPCRLILKVIQNDSAAKTLTFNDLTFCVGGKASGALAPSTTLSSINIYFIYYDGTNYHTSLLIGSAA